MEESLAAMVSISEPTEASIEEWETLEDEQYEEELSEETLPFNFEIAIAVLEEDEEDMETYFVKSVSEIGGKKQFPCDSCDKVCKSKGGLTRHVNAKHHRNKANTEPSKEMSALRKDSLISNR